MNNILFKIILISIIFSSVISAYSQNAADYNGVYEVSPKEGIYKNKLVRIHWFYYFHLIINFEVLNKKNPEKKYVNHFYTAFTRGMGDEALVGTDRNTAIEEKGKLIYTQNQKFPSFNIYGGKAGKDLYEIHHKDIGTAVYKKVSKYGWDSTATHFYKYFDLVLQKQEKEVKKTYHRGEDVYILAQIMRTNKDPLAYIYTYELPTSYTTEIDAVLSIEGGPYKTENSLDKINLSEFERVKEIINKCLYQRTDGLHTNIPYLPNLKRIRIHLTSSPKNHASNVFDIVVTAEKSKEPFQIEKAKDFNDLTVIARRNQVVRKGN